MCPIAVFAAHLSADRRLGESVIESTNQSMRRPTDDWVQTDEGSLERAADRKNLHKQAYSFTILTILAQRPELSFYHFSDVTVSLPRINPPVGE